MHHSSLRLRRLRLLVAVATLALAAVAAAQPEPPPGEPSRATWSRPVVGACTLTGTVDSGSAAYLVDCVARARSAGHDALLIRLDTPGGALEATREIVRAFLGSEVPVLVWVGPSGARAGSAGVFVTLASHVAGMAPGTNIGAAHPVVGPGGQDPEEAAGKAMAEKVLNDTSAFAESIAKQRGRNAEWAVQAVRESASVAAERAVELRVVEILAPTEAAFLAAADGRSVQTPAGEVTLRTAEARIEEIEPTFRQRLVHGLSNPSVAYLLFVIGGLCLAIELSNPGLIIPGLLGGICLVLALIAFSALPVEAGAVVLLVIAIGLIVAEFFVGNGLLAAGGIVLLLLGGLLLVDDFDLDWFVEPSFDISLRLLIPTVLVLGGGAVYLVLRAAQTRTVPQQGGDLGLIGETGRALSDIGSSGGEVFVHGERWRAVSARPIVQGATVVVRSVDGLTLTVEEMR